MPNQNVRSYWIEIAEKLARPVLTSLAEGRLKELMPLEIAAGANKADRANYTYLEALGRLLSGIAPWLELGDDGSEEGKLRGELAELARRAIASGTNPTSPDFLNFEHGMQPLVDTAFLSQAILRAPNEFWAKLEPDVQRNLVGCLEATRNRKPGPNNWLLFAAITEAALKNMGQFWDPMRIDYTPFASTLNGIVEMAFMATAPTSIGTITTAS